MIHYILLSLIFLLLSTTPSSVDARSRLKATLDFSSDTHNVIPSFNSPRVYFCGKIVPTYAHDTTKIIFDIPKNSNQNRFFILVTQEFTIKRKDIFQDENCQNTIDYLYVKKDDFYKFFVLDLVVDECTTHDESIEALIKAEEQKTYHWDIHEETLPENGIIPDATVIVCYFPDMLHEIKGGSAHELPTLYFNNENFVQTNNDEMEDALIRLRIAAINTDTIHAPIKRKIETKNNRLLIMDIA